MLGMAVAKKLAQQGAKVTLFDSAPNVGGLTSAWQIGDVTWDKYYHVTLLSDRYLRGLLKELDLDDEIDWVQTRTGFYSKGKLHSLSSSLDFLRFPVLNLYQKFRLGMTIFCASKRSDWQSLEQRSVESWLRKWSGNSTFESIWLPLLKCKLGDAYQRTNAAFIWAYIQRMYAARRSGMKREMFGIVQGGYGRVLAELRTHLLHQGIEIVTDAKVTRVESINDSPQASASRFHIDFLQGQQSQVHEFDRVVLTVPSPIVEAIAKDLAPHEREGLSKTEYLGVICTSLLLSKPLGGFYVTNITDPGIPITGVIEMGTMLPPSKLGGHYLVYLPQYMMANDSRFRESDEIIHERCLSTLEGMYSHFDRNQVKAIQTARASHVMAIPTLNYSAERAPIACERRGLYVLNSARIVDGTLNVNEILRLVDQEFGALQ
jgi:protoporphyrinogen oxidase